MSREDVKALKNFFADRFMRLQDTGCRKVITGKKFKSANALGLTRAFDPSMKGESQITTVTCEEILEYVHHADPAVCMSVHVCMCVCMCVWVT